VGNRPDHGLEVAQNLLIGNRETEEIQKAIAEFLRNLEAGKKDIKRAENREKPAR
jgi:hypothetical protein